MHEIHLQYKDFIYWFELIEFSPIIDSITGSVYYPSALHPLTLYVKMSELMFFTLIGKTKTHSWLYEDLKQLELDDEYPAIFRIIEFQFDNHECGRNGEYEINMCTIRFEVQPLKEIIANARNYIEDFLLHFYILPIRHTLNHKV